MVESISRTDYPHVYEYDWASRNYRCIYCEFSKEELIRSLKYDICTIRIPDEICLQHGYDRSATNQAIHQTVLAAVVRNSY